MLVLLLIANNLKGTQRPPIASYISFRLTGLFIDDDEISNVSCAPLILMVLTYYILSPCKIVNPLFLKFICLVDLSCFSSLVLGAKYIRLNEYNLGWDKHANKYLQHVLLRHFAKDTQRGCGVVGQSGFI